MAFPSYTYLDLTHPLSPEIPTWNGSCGFCLEMKRDDAFRIQKITMHAGIGTHMDAPSHRFAEGISIGQIPLQELIVPACVLDVRGIDAESRISVEDIRRYEAAYGIIPPHALVIGYTGWSRFWTQPNAYRNPDASGQMHFPAFSAEAAAYLLERQIAGIAIDTLSPDCTDPSFPVHRLILGAGKYIIENIADCAALPPRGSYVIALPLRAEAATESPLRLIALIPKQKAVSF